MPLLHSPKAALRKAVLDVATSCLHGPPHVVVPAVKVLHLGG